MDEYVPWISSIAALVGLAMLGRAFTGASTVEAGSVGFWGGGIALLGAVLALAYLRVAIHRHGKRK